MSTPTPTSDKNLTFTKENIIKPGENDVLFGRGGGTNNHPGNIKFRQLCFEHKFRYLAASKVDKPKVAREVVAVWRNQNPVGRFLTKASRDSAQGKEEVWHDVGDQKAREKSSQCLRERTADVMPFIKQLQRQAQTANASNKGALPDVAASSMRVGQEEYEFDAAAIAVALLNKQVDGRESPQLNQYLQKIAECGTGDDMSIDENASVAAIAKALFKHAKDEDDTMSFAEFLHSHKKLDGDLDSIFSDAMSKSTWAKSYGMDNDMSVTSLGHIGEGEPLPDYVSSNNRNTKINYAKSNASSMSMLSEITDAFEGDSLGFKVGPQHLRDLRWESVGTLKSGVSDMTGDFSNI